MQYNQLTIGDVIAKDYRKAIVFLKHDLNFCLLKNSKINDLPSQKYQKVIKALEKVNLDYNLLESKCANWKTEEIIEHVIFNHHKYVRDIMTQLPLLFELDCGCKSNSNCSSVLDKINTHFQLISENLIKHLEEEENHIFPYINLLEHCKSSIVKPKKIGDNTIIDPFNLKESEHDIVDQLIDKIKLLLDNNALIKKSCIKFNVCALLLEEFDENFQSHIYLENNILFSRAKKLEG